MAYRGTSQPDLEFAWDRPAEGFELSSSIRLIETPGHSPQDVSTLVDTDGRLVVFTHLWWTATVPA